MDTIYALSSGAPPAGIGVVRVSGPAAGATLVALAGELPPPRRARLSTLCGGDGAVLDEALVLWFPGPQTATGEDLAEFHLHGGRAVIAAVEAAIGIVEGTRRAQPGEFTRRAFANGRLDLAQAEGLGDLLAAETELQRQAAIGLAGGVLSRRVEGWRAQLLAISAAIEAEMDFDDEDDVHARNLDYPHKINDLARDIEVSLAAPAAEALREGYRVALAGPPNAGKSTLFNALVESEAAITAPIAGTTRDVLTRPVALQGVPFTFVDMAGLRDSGGDTVEAIGIDRARSELARADLVLWLGAEGEGPAGAWEIDAQCDRVERAVKFKPTHRVSALTGEGLVGLKQSLVDHATKALPRPGEVALNQRQRRLIAEAHSALAALAPSDDLLIVAEHLRQARVSFDFLTGRAGTEDVLDNLFGQFCIGK